MDIVLAGQPNSGKSLVFSRMTGLDSMVSNYSGTSLEAVRSRMLLGESGDYYLVDTPGIYSLSIAEGLAETARNAILGSDTNLILNVVDANQLARNLVLTLELLEMGLPMILVLNQIEMARGSGVEIDAGKLSAILKCPVVQFSAFTGEGVEELKALIHKGTNQGFENIRPTTVFIGEESYSPCNGDCIHCRFDRDKAGCSEDKVLAGYKRAQDIADKVSTSGMQKAGWLKSFERVLDQSQVGTLVLALLALVSFAALVGFVGMAEGLVTNILSPLQSLISGAIAGIIPPGFWNGVLSKGIPEGLVLPFTLVMPAMLIVSLIMSLMEDIGLLPRYAVVLERIGRFFGVSGQAVIPLSLGFGCRTPAVAATRILPNYEQRFIIVALLSIVIPCAGTIGMLTSAIVALHAYTWVVVGSMLLVFMALGWVLKKLYGQEEEPVFELPSLRIPSPGNIWTKVMMRFKGLFTEVLPLLLVMSIGVRILIDSRALESLHRFEAVTNALFGIPPEAVAAVLVAMVQRYLAPLVIINLNLTPREATIAISMIALSVPCLPVMVMTVRELGVRALLKILGMGVAVSLMVGIVLNTILPV